MMKIETGKRGVVTNQEMIPAIKNNIENAEVLKELYETYNEVFNSSMKYLSKKEMNKIEEFGIQIEKHERKSIIRFDEETESIKKGYIVSGKRTITNQQMLPAIKVNIDNVDALRTLRNDYREVFESSMKYLSVKTQNLIREVLEVKETKKVIEISDHFKSKNNEKLAIAFKNNQNLSDLSNDEIALLELALQDKSTKEIAEHFNMTKDMVYNALFRSKYSIYNRLA